MNSVPQTLSISQMGSRQGVSKRGRPPKKQKDDDGLFIDELVKGVGMTDLSAEFDAKLGRLAQILTAPLGDPGGTGIE